MSCQHISSVPCTLQETVWGCNKLAQGPAKLPGEAEQGRASWRFWSVVTSLALGGLHPQGRVCILTYPATGSHVNLKDRVGGRNQKVEEAFHEISILGGFRVERAFLREKEGTVSQRAENPLASRGLLLTRVLSTFAFFPEHQNGPLCPRARILVFFSNTTFLQVN